MTDQILDFPFPTEYEKKKCVDFIQEIIIMLKTERNCVS